MWLAIAIMLAVVGFLVWAGTRKSGFGHWMRVVVMFLSFGFIFSHEMTQNEDTARQDADKDAKVKKQ